ncbi:MAG: polysaccharide biosynthesis protein [Herbinix sp.]|jgi:capsular exopolysaccharide synthesis family protein|nr:polysaccharide biosynthesis protein [Herbinix sp.]MDF2908150.1 polysaccharide biosynthesis protein [Herbinix sp.]
MEHNIFSTREELDFRTNESYKTLRTNIQFCGDDIKVISLTSCMPSEGKTSVSFNLAVSFAEAGKKVILIDADLRRSVLAGRYRVGEVQGGLTHYLIGEKKLDEVVKDTDINNMDVIFAGATCPNPAELLNHQRFEDMINILKEIYDYVIIDTPPLGSVIDGAIISRICDGAVLVLEANLISYRFAHDVKEQLKKSNCKILGAILNKVPIDKQGYYGRYYGKHYGKYYGASEEEKDQKKLKKSQA